MPNLDYEIMPGFEKFNLLDTRRRQKEADAALVEAWGCTCKLLRLQAKPTARVVMNGENRGIHEHACPIALADQIRSTP